MASIGDAIRPYALNGMPPKDIARLTGFTPEAVRGAMSRLRAEGEGIPYFASGPKASKMTSTACAVKLREAAEKRGITPRELARKILDTVLFEDMLDAVLDDQDEAA